MKKSQNKLLKPLIIVSGILVVIILIFVSVLVGKGIAEKKAREAAKEDNVLTSATVMKAIESAGELTTTKYYYQSIERYEDHKEVFGKKLPFTTEESLYTYDGVINAGVDISKSKCSVDEASKKIEIKLPKPQILSHEIDQNSFKFYDVKDAVFNETDLDKFTGQTAVLKEAKEEELLKDDEFNETVISNAETTLKGFLTFSQEMKDYDVIFSIDEDDNSATSSGTVSAAK